MYYIMLIKLNKILKLLSDYLIYTDYKIYYNNACKMDAIYK